MSAAGPSNSSPPRNMMSPAALNTIIWIALMFAPVMYTVVSFLMRPGGPIVAPPDFSKSIELVLTVGAIATTLAGFVVPRIVAAQMKTVVAADPARRANAEQMVMIVRGALFEAVAIYGFVMVNIGTPAGKVVPFAVLSFLLLVALFPTPERLAQPFED